MPVTTYTCEYDDCNEEFKTETLEHYITLLKLHVDARHKQHTTSAKAEKAKRPELTADVSDKDWSYFSSRGTQYKKATGLTGEDIVTQLLECCNEQLRRDHHRTFSGATESNDEDTVLAQLKQIAVCKRNLAVNRVQLGTLKQDRACEEVCGPCQESRRGDWLHHQVLQGRLQHGLELPRGHGD